MGGADADERLLCALLGVGGATAPGAGVAGAGTPGTSTIRPPAPVCPGTGGATRLEELLLSALLGVGGAAALRPGVPGAGVPDAMPLEPEAPAPLALKAQMTLRSIFLAPYLE